MINQYAQLPDGPGGTRHYNLAICLAAKQVKTMLLIGSAELNTGRQRYSGLAPWKTIIRNKTRIGIIKTIPIVGNGPLRIAGMIQFAVLSFLYLICARISKGAVIYASTPQPFACWTAWIYAKVSGKRFILEIRDLWPESLFSLGLMKRSSTAGKGLSMLDTFLVDRSEMVVSLLLKSNEYYKGKTRPGKKFIYIPNGVQIPGSDDRETLYLVKPNSLELSDNNQKSDHCIFTYFGALGYANAAHIIVEGSRLLAGLIDSSTFTVKIFGAGPERECIDQSIIDYNLPNVQLLPPFAKSDMLSAVEGTSCFIFHLRPAEVFEYGISPNKLIDYMILGKPIVFCGGSWPNPLEDAGVAISAKPMDPKSMAQAMLKVIHTPLEERRRLGSEAQAYVLRKHSFAYLSSRLYAELWASEDFYGDVEFPLVPRT